MRVEFKPKHAGYRLYVRFDPTVNGNGGGGAGNGGADRATIDDSTGHPVLVSSDPVTATNAANRDYAQPVYAALDGPFSEASSGFAGAASDGLVQLDAAHALTTTYVDALGGNVVQTARVELERDGKRRARARLRRHPGRGGRHGRGLARRRLRRGARAPTRAAGSTYDNSLTKPRTEKLRGLKSAERKRLEDEYYLERQRDQGLRGQDVPRRDRGQPRLAVGPGGLGRRSRRTRTSAPTARCSRATSTSRGPASSPPATSRRRATRRSSSSSGSSCRTARCRATASSTARSHRTRSGRSSTRRPTRS